MQLEIGGLIHIQYIVCLCFAAITSVSHIDFTQDAR